MKKIRFKKKCDFYAILGYGSNARFICTLSYRNTKCEGCHGKCRCPKTREKRRQIILNRLNGKAK